MFVPSVSTGDSAFLLPRVRFVPEVPSNLFLPREWPFSYLLNQAEGSLTKVHLHSLNKHSTTDGILGKLASQTVVSVSCTVDRPCLEEHSGGRFLTSALGLHSCVTLHTCAHTLRNTHTHHILTRERKRNNSKNNFSGPGM